MGAEGPSGFAYHADVVTPDEERALLERLEALPFSEVRMRGQVARRRTAHFGWRYGYETWRVEPGPPLPDFLEPLRDRAAGLAGVPPATLVEVLVTDYPPGAGIGWHRDAPAFGVVVGVSLLSACRLRFRRGGAGTRATWTAELAPRSAYRLAGPARWQWQHSIPAVRAPRYSVTFRTLREAGATTRRTPTPPRPS
jgi:alkylated DNA repair dioxygenase AlkB